MKKIIYRVLKSSMTTINKEVKYKKDKQKY